MTPGYRDQNPSYWQEYTNLQKVKHDLIRQYLNGWFPKLASWATRVLYFDTHAGVGRYKSGEVGSPLVAIDTLLNHRARDRLLEHCEVKCFLIERDVSNLEALKREIAELGELPTGMQIIPHPTDCFETLESLIEGLRSRRRQLAPAFFFVDPYGFKIPGRILAALMQFPHVELFVNVIWRELDMALTHAHRDPTSSHADNMSMIFGSDRWRSITATDHNERAEQAVDAFREMTGAQWSTHVRMLGDNRATRYVMLHLTNHAAGRDLMKSCVWKVCPDGTYCARKGDNPRQELLITPMPDLSPLKDWIETELQDGPMRWQELDERLRGQLWLSAHLNKVLREMRRNVEITATDFASPFSRKTNPLLASASWLEETGIW